MATVRSTSNQLQPAGGGSPETGLALGIQFNKTLMSI